MSTQEAVVRVASIVSITVLTCFGLRTIRDIHRDVQNALAGK